MLLHPLVAAGRSGTRAKAGSPYTRHDRMLDSVLRPVKDRTLRPVVGVFAGAAHPNLLTLLGFAAGVGSAVLLIQRAYAPALLLWLLNRLLDGLDGAVARAEGRQSDFGGYLDILLDFSVYALIPLCLVLGRPDARGAWIALALLLCAFYVNSASWMYLAALLEKRGEGARVRGEETSVTMPRGLVEGTETILLYTLFILLPEHLVPLLLLMAVAVALTVAQRLLWAARAL